MANVEQAGRLFLLSLSTDGTTYEDFACTTSTGVTSTFNTVDGSCMQDNGNPKPVFTNWEGEATAEGIIGIDDTDQSWNIEEYYTYAKTGTLLYYKFGPIATGEKRITGQCVFSALNPSGSKDELGTYSATLSHYGDITFEVNT